MLFVFLASCRAKPKYYTLEDFDFVVIGETTSEAVDEKIFSKHSCIVAATSFGAVQSYPMKDGRYITIKYLGPDMVVGSIEITDEPF